MVGLILVIACGNVGMLLSARNNARRREFSIRLAIGGTQWRLCRQLLAESFVLVASGALLGWGFSLIATRALAVWTKIEISLSPDHTVLIFTLAISAGVGLAFGLGPLFTIARMRGASAMRNSSATSFQEASTHVFRRGIVTLQVALGLILAIAAGLLIRTLHNLEQIGRAHV